MGVLVFAALLAVILLPALIFSTLNPGLVLNNVGGVSCSFAIGSDSGTFELFSTGRTQSSLLYSDGHGAFGFGREERFRVMSSCPHAHHVLTHCTTDDKFKQLQKFSVGPYPVVSPLLTSWEPQTQEFVLYPYPDAPWEISPPALQVSCCCSRLRCLLK
jgi:hypothetical protein